MNASGFRELGFDSSELQVAGGANKTWQNIVEKIRNMFDFVGDYVPKIIQGFIDGLTGAKLFE